MIGVAIVLTIEVAVEEGADAAEIEALLSITTTEISAERWEALIEKTEVFSSPAETAETHAKEGGQDTEGTGAEEAAGDVVVIKLWNDMYEG